MKKKVYIYIHTNFAVCRETEVQYIYIYIYIYICIHVHIYDYAHKRVAGCVKTKQEEENLKSHLATQFNTSENGSADFEA